jgi:hypothetical protein
MDKFSIQNIQRLNSISDNQIKDSDLAEALEQAENDFYQKRKELIKARLKESGLAQNDLAKILGHRKGLTKRDFDLQNGLIKNELRLVTFVGKNTRRPSTEIRFRTKMQFKINNGECSLLIFLSGNIN